MLPVRFVPTARREFDGARRWYEQQSSGLGERFEAAIHAKLLSLRERPDFYACVHDDIREASLTKFPYTIYFRVETDEIIVASVFHNSRDPDVWQSRWEE